MYVQCCVICLCICCSLMASSMDLSRDRGSSTLIDDHEQLVTMIRRGNVDGLKAFIEPISKSSRLLRALSQVSNSGQYPLHYTIKDISPDSQIDGRAPMVSLILDNLPDGEKKEYLTHRNTQGQTALHTAAWADEVDVINEILNSLSTRCEREELVKLKDGKKRSVLQYELSQRCKRLIEEYGTVSAQYTDENDMEIEECSDFVNVYQPHELVAWSPDICDVGKLAISSKSEEFMLSDNEHPEEDTIYLTPENAFAHFEKVIAYVRTLKTIDIVLNLKNPEGMTILHIAAKYGKHDLVDRLLSAVSVTIDKEAKWKLIKEKCGLSRTTLHYAVLSRCPHTTQRILDHGKDYRKLLLPEKDKDGNTALHIATSLPRSDLAHKLLSSIDQFELREHLITETCNQHKTPLHIAAQMKSNVFAKLLDHMEDKQQVLCHTDLEGKTILHLLCLHQSTNVIDSLLAEIRDPKQKLELLNRQCNSDGKTALHYAAASNDIAKVKVLLRHCGGQDFELTNAEDNSGHTPRKYATSGQVNDFFCKVKNYYWRTMETPPTALIFYTKLEGYPQHERKGADEEKDQIKSALEFCGIEPQVFPDFSKNQLIEEIRKAQSQQKGRISGFIVIIMTHAEDNWLADCDLNRINIQSVVDDICDPDAGLDHVPKVTCLTSVLFNMYW